MIALAIGSLRDASQGDIAVLYSDGSIDLFYNVSMPGHVAYSCATALRQTFQTPEQIMIGAVNPQNPRTIVVSDSGANQVTTLSLP
jgi:hypothetical protein